MVATQFHAVNDALGLTGALFQDSTTFWVLQTHTFAKVTQVANGKRTLLAADCRYVDAFVLVSNLVPHLLSCGTITMITVRDIRSHSWRCPASHLAQYGTTSWILDLGSRIRGPRSRIQDPGSRIQDQGSRIQAPRSMIKDP